MAFSFGAPAGGASGFGAPAAPSAGSAAGSGSSAGSGGGFSFGGSSTPAPAATGGLSFGGSTTPAPASTGGFSFGGATATPAPATAEAPATGGFGATPAAPGAPSSTGGFSFGGSTAPAPGGAFGAGAPSSSASAAVDTPKSTVDVPDWVKHHKLDLYPRLLDLAKKCLNSDDTKAGEQLVQLCDPSIFVAAPYTLQAANPSLRQQITQNPHVMLDGQLATLTPNMWEQIVQLTDQCALSEVDAMSLFAYLSRKPHVSDLLQDAKEAVHYARSLPLETLRSLLQLRLGATDHHVLLRATDPIVQQDIVPHLLKVLTHFSSPQQDARFLALAMEQRQVAAECVFFLAYHTQLTLPEVAAMVEWVRQASLPKLDPLRDVPSVYENDQAGSTNFSAPLPPLQEKDPLDWQEEWMAHTHQLPHLLRCVATVTCAILTALNPEAALHDRRTHQQLDENALRSESSLGLRVDSWARHDWFGLIQAAVTLLEGGRTGLEAPAAYQSFTLARLSLLPALLVPSHDESCQVSDFLVEVLASFCLRYWNALIRTGDRPISRAQWLQDAEEDLRLRRQEVERDRSFQQWSGTDSKLQKVPDSVNLLERPDCMDDIVAVVVAVASINPYVAALFWDRDEDGSLLHHPILGDLKRQQQEDRSLQPCYVSLLSVLATVESPEPGSQSGADLVHEILLEAPSADAKVHCDYVWLIETCRWYARKLDPQTSASTKSSSSRNDRQSSSTAYYYISRGGTRESDQESKSRHQSTNSSPLSETNAFILGSILALLSNVASNSAESRMCILSMKPSFSSKDGGSGSSSKESTLKILFSLASVALTPELRGCVFTVISALLKSVEDDSGSARVLAFALEAWDLLEEYQFLPIYLLDQYPSVRDSDQQALPSISFASTSTAIVKAERSKDSWIPVKPSFGILYEMEHIESVLGVYPSTVGFLRLLGSLFRVGGSPSGLGSSWRFRPGCSPYIEYVVHFVVPRVTGQLEGSLKPLRFRTSQDKLVLLQAALVVSEVLVTRAVVPSKGAFNIPSTDELASNRILGLTSDKDVSNQTSSFVFGKERAIEAIGFSPLVESLFLKPAQDTGMSADDIAPPPRTSTKPEKTSTLHNSTSNSALTAMNPSLVGLNAHIPHAKSPECTVLLEILSTTGGSLMRSIIAIVVELHAQHRAAREADRASLAGALFVPFRPTFHRLAKASGSYGSVMSASTSGMEPLRASYDLPSFTATLEYRTCVLRLCLRHLCAAACREDAMRDATSILGGTLSLVPVLRFQKASQPTAHLVESRVKIRSVAEVVSSSTQGRALLGALIDFLNEQTSDTEENYSLSTIATCLMFYLDKALSKGGSLGDYLLRDRSMSTRFTVNMSRRLLSSLFCGSHVFEFILRHVAGALRPRTQGGGSSATALALLGLPTSDAEATSFISRSDASIDCFGALIQILVPGSMNRSMLKPDVLRFAYEILFFTCDPSSNGLPFVMSASCSARLRQVNLWTTSASHLIDLYMSCSTDSRPWILQSLGWVFRGLANDFRVLSGSVASIYHGCPPRPTESARILNALVAGESGSIMSMFLSALSLVRGPVASEGDLMPPPEAVVRLALRPLESQYGSIKGYDVVDIEKITRLAYGQSDEVITQWISWSKHRSDDVQIEFACAHLTHSLYALLTVLVEVTETTDPSMWLHLTASLVRVLLAGGSSGGHIDNCMYTAATRNIALSIFVTSQCAVASRSTTDVVDMSRSLALAIDVSGASDLNLSRERTVALASALVSSLARIQQTETPLQDRAVYLRATDVLARLAFDRAGSNAAQSTPHSELARCLLTYLTSFLSNQTSEDARYEDLNMSSQRYQSLIRQLRVNDSESSSLVSSIARWPLLSTRLCSCGLLDAVKAAATDYMRDEESFTSSYETSRLHSDPNPGIPRIFVGHIELATSLLTNDCHSKSTRLEVAQFCSEILTIYEPICLRLIKRFPTDGDVLLSTVQCLALARTSSTDHMLTEPWSRSMIPKEGKMNSVHARLTALCFFMAESTLPQPYMLSSPATLESPEGPSDWNVDLEPSANMGSSWWDDLGLEVPRSNTAGWLHGDRPNKLTIEILQLASKAASLVRDGLQAVGRLSIKASIDLETLLRCVYKNAGVLRVLAHAEPSDPAVDARAFYPLVREFHGKVVMIVSDLLGFALIKVRERLARVDSLGFEVHSKDAEHVRSIVRYTLDQTKLDTTGTTRVRATSNDENDRDRLLELAQALREAIGTQKHLPKPQFEFNPALTSR